MSSTHQASLCIPNNPSSFQKATMPELQITSVMILLKSSASKPSPLSFSLLLLVVLGASLQQTLLIGLITTSDDEQADIQAKMAKCKQCKALREEAAQLEAERLKRE
ncbi:hypothetical protein M404DRAFT_17818 [Pisolithus tinctorius Marx 270]|uniref:Uncharacterized protein n=1 Tax=Pisolithus tinctorius Marx 270 TaxID=870435 RepID=A0A0C3PL53_PISTI|nr:hypothetical protein M404DRAFT_17818 [Pisolithus tinctorius Marx 270]